MNPSLKKLMNYNFQTLLLYFLPKQCLMGILTLINQEGIYIPLQLILQKKILKLEGKDGEKKISFLKMG